MSRHETYYQPRTFDVCGCRRRGAYFHGPEKEWACDRCWRKLDRVLARHRVCLSYGTNTCATEARR
jgi:hypothetical protein